jgi:hypothetical protein
MVAIKSNILKRMDTAPIGVRVCCIKLLQRIVQVQTPGVISDPRVRRWPSLSTQSIPTEADMYVATRAKRDLYLPSTKESPFPVYPSVGSRSIGLARSATRCLSTEHKVGTAAQSKD